MNLTRKIVEYPDICDQKSKNQLIMEVITMESKAFAEIGRAHV